MSLKDVSKSLTKCSTGLEDPEEFWTNLEKYEKVPAKIRVVVHELGIKMQKSSFRSTPRRILQFTTAPTFL